MRCPECGNFYAHNNFYSQFRRAKAEQPANMRFVKVSDGVQWLFGNVNGKGAMKELRKLLERKP